MEIVVVNPEEVKSELAHLEITLQLPSAPEIIQDKYIVSVKSTMKAVVRKRFGANVSKPLFIITYVGEGHSQDETIRKCIEDFLNGNFYNKEFKVHDDCDFGMRFETNWNDIRFNYTNWPNEFKEMFNDIFSQKTYKNTLSFLH